MAARSIAWHRIGRDAVGSAPTTSGGWRCFGGQDDPVVVKSTGRRGRVVDVVAAVGDDDDDDDESAAAGTTTNEQKQQDVDRPSPAAVPDKKRPKIEVAAGDAGDHPFCCCKKKDREQQCCRVQYDDDASIEIVHLRRLVPIYSERRRQQRPASKKEAALPILVARDTDTFRILASTQLVTQQQEHQHDRNNDATACAAGDAVRVVLEIGSSTGEMSQLLWKQQHVACWMGWDAGTDMVQRVQRKLQQQQHSRANRAKGNNNNNNNNINNNQKRSCHKMDPLMEPDRAAHLVRQEFNLSSAASKLQPQQPQQPQQLTVFVDIGGDRQLHAVVLLLHWILESFSSESTNNDDNIMLCQIIVKSETLYQALRDHQNSGPPSSSGDFGDGSSFFLDDGGDWLKLQWRTAVRESFPRHPLQAPRRMLPLPNKNDDPGEGRAVCRYHNYHPDGCAKHSDGRCPYDHDHCHLCLKIGHVSRNCDWIRNGDKDW